MRRLTRYSIRSLLVLVTLTSVLLAWYATNVRAYRAERAAFARLEEMHGMIGLEVDGVDDSRLHPWCGTGVFGYGTMERISPFGVDRLLGRYGEAFLRVKELELYQTTGGPLSETFDELTHFSHLSRLEIEGLRVSEPDRERIRAMLPNTQIEFTEGDFPKDFSWRSYKDIIPFADAPPQPAPKEIDEPDAEGEVDDDPFATGDHDNPFDFK
jgi:hypothetical protein